MPPLTAVHNTCCPIWKLVFSQYSVQKLLRMGEFSQTVPFYVNADYKRNGIHGEGKNICWQYGDYCITKSVPDILA